MSELKAWLAGLGVSSSSDLRPASSDASFRRYFRMRSGRESLIAMDAPPAQENSLPFVRVAGFLEAMQLNAPRVIEADLDRGFLLLSDLGCMQYLEKLVAEPHSSQQLYADALTALHRMQKRGVAYQTMLPPYDADLLATELSLFRVWLCDRHAGIQFSSDDVAAWHDTSSLLIRNALDQPQVFVHRDFHSRNLMLTASDNPGILDFQDAVEGPLTYDLVSLLKDCYIAWPPASVRTWATQFYALLDESLQAVVGLEQFMRYFELMGVQRHLKAAGIFARLNHRDNKPAYLDDIPRTLGYILELAPRYDELQFLENLIAERVLPKLGSSA